jgi:hypothetical protein
MGYGEDGMMIENDFIAMNANRRSGSSGRESRSEKTGTIEQGSKLEDLNPKEYEEVMDFIQMYHSLEYLPDKEEYYWNESDYEDDLLAKRNELFDKLEAEATRDADGNLVVDVDEETFAMICKFDGDDENISQEKEGQNVPEKDTPDQRQAGPYEEDVEFVMDMMGIKGSNKPPNPAQYDKVTPLNLKGPTWSDFVESMMEHPTKFGQVKFVSPHPESTREPVPDLPSSRRNPPPEFVENSKRFIYVWGLPPLTVNGEPGDLDNPVHAMEIKKQVGILFDVPPEAVFAASVSSAFVGFPSKIEQRFALVFGPVTKELASPVTISKYVPKEGDRKTFSDEEMDRVVLLENLPEGLTPTSLASNLFPKDGDNVGNMVYGDLKSEDFVMLTPHSAAVRFESAEIAENAVHSSIVEARLIEFGQHRVRYNKARREMIFTGKHKGPLGTTLERVPGPRLIVDGDMPTKKFFLSHASSVHLRNLDPSTTKKEISDFFQPCCHLPRDVEGSIEFVTCYEGMPTGKAYVGFDEHGEVEAAMSLGESNGRLIGLGHSKVIMKRVRDAVKIPREKRPMREEEELLDSLDNWEQYADPEDLEELYANGISKEALDEALRAIRYQNPTFSSLDQAMRTETINPEKESGGMYRELVQMYISTLKECLSTPENPGPIYESLFLPDEEIDTEIFENEPVRQEDLKKRREVP